MATRLTLPQQRAIETRGRILDAAARVFARRGFGQATVQDIADEAEISMGALYHHFAGKEELFRALAEDHVRRDVMEYEPQPAASFREALQHFVAHMIGHLQQKHDIALNMELWAQATREEWAREVIAEEFRTFRGLLERMLRIAQEAGVARRDLDVQASCVLVEALFAGTAVQWAVDPKAIDLKSLEKTWVDLLERFVQTDGGGDVAALEGRVQEMIDDLRDEHK
jgi:AcrR family transcriptional regulator